MRTTTTQRQQAQLVNSIIDQALLAPSTQHQQQLIEFISTISVTPLAERVRKRATLLGKRHKGDISPLLAVRDDLIMALYAAMVPQGWACAWCDGSSIKLDAHYQAGIGGIVMDNNGSVIIRISRAIGDHRAYEAELVAVAAVISSALEHQLRRLWVYTDNHGLAQLWQEHRDDNRLAEIRRLVSGLQRFALQALPRHHNQPANALAKKAIGHV